MSEMERRVQNKKKKKSTSLEVETDTRISAVTFFPNLSSGEVIPSVFFPRASLTWGLSHTSAWIKSCPVLQAMCCLKRDRAWTNCACMTLDLDRASMTCERCVALSVYVRV